MSNPLRQKKTPGKEEGGTRPGIPLTLPSMLAVLFLALVAISSSYLVGVMFGRSQWESSSPMSTDSSDAPRSVHPDGDGAESAAAGTPATDEEAPATEGEPPEGILSGIGGNAAHFCRAGDHCAGFQAVQQQQFLLTCVGFHIQNLTGHHTKGATGVGQRLYGTGLLIAGQTRCGCDAAEGCRLQSVAGQHGHGFTVHLVVGRLSAAQIIVIHAGKIVMDQRVGMHHFHRASQRQRVLPMTAIQLAECQRQHGAHAFSARQETVAHGIIQGVPRVPAGKLRRKIGFDLRQICGALGFKRTGHDSFTLFPAVKGLFPGCTIGALDEFDNLLLRLIQHRSAG